MYRGQSNISAIFRATKMLIIAIFTTASAMAQSSTTTDISNAIIHNEYRFVGYGGNDYYELYQTDGVIEVYINDNGWKKLKLGTDFTFRIQNSDGEDVDKVIDRGTYNLVVTGIGNYSGETSQTLCISGSGIWSDYKANFFSQIDSENSVITITSEAELALLAWHFNNNNYFFAEYKGWTFRLACDLDLSNYFWIPIGSDTPGSDVAFLGHFDGQGHTIKGMHVERFNKGSQSDYFYPQGLFGLIAKGASIKNLTLTESEIVSGYNFGVGALVGHANYGTTIENCHVTSSVNVVCSFGTDSEYAGEYYGGIVGYSSADMAGCTSGANIFKEMDTKGCTAFGGIVGRCAINSFGHLSNCIYYGNNVFADSNAGAVAGMMENSRNAVTNCYYTHGKLNGSGNDDQRGITQVKGYDLDNVFDVDFGGDMTTEYSFGGIKVYPNAMVYDGVCYTLPQYVKTLEGAGTADAPYLIKTTAHLDMLAACVNNGNLFTGKHFKLCNNLTYDATEGKYTTIGYWDGSAGYYFDGVFDGGNHSISGIYISKNGKTQADKYQGIFGWTGKNCVIKNLLVCSCTFNAHEATGAIVGSNEGRIENCHVLGDVSVNAVTGKTYYHGGIVGFNNTTGVVTGCSSCVSMTEIDAGACGDVGGIVGLNYGEISNCLALGCDINGTTYIGAIVGENDKGLLSQNYYSACRWSSTQGTVTKTVGIGCGGKGDDSADIETGEGAVPALCDDCDNSLSIAQLSARAKYLYDNGFASMSTADLCLSWRTLWKDGSWNTLCLPFAVSNIDGTPLEGAMVLTLDNASFDAGTLTLNFTNATTIEAGVPYIVKWPNDTENQALADPVFRDVTISTCSPEDKAAATDVVVFKGQYAPLTISGEADNTLLFMGADNLLYYPKSSMTINAFRAYFKLQGGLVAGEPSSHGNFNSIVLNFDGSITRIDHPDTSAPVFRYDDWFTLDGRKITGKPKAKGLYINSGKKMVIE